MVLGAFKSFKHEHFFRESENGVLMIDKFNFQLPYGVLGRLVNWFFLKRYMTKHSKTRNSILKIKEESLNPVKMSYPY